MKLPPGPFAITGPLEPLPSRETGYHTPPAPVASFSYHQAKREASQERIRATVAQLQSENILPATATARAALIIERGNVSNKTLYLAVNRPLWHPEHIPSQPIPTVQPQAKPASFQPQSIPDQTPETKQPEPLKKGLTLQPFKYVGFVILNLLKEAAAALTPSGRKASYSGAAPSRNSELGGFGGEPDHSPAAYHQLARPQNQPSRRPSNQNRPGRTTAKTSPSARAAAPPTGSVQTAQSQAAADP